MDIVKGQTPSKVYVLGLTACSSCWTTSLWRKMGKLQTMFFKAIHTGTQTRGPARFNYQHRQAVL